MLAVGGRLRSDRLDLSAGRVSVPTTLSSACPEPATQERGQGKSYDVFYNLVAEVAHRYSSSVFLESQVSRVHWAGKNTGVSTRGQDPRGHLGGRLPLRHFLGTCLMPHAVTFIISFGHHMTLSGSSLHLIFQMKQ